MLFMGKNFSRQILDDWQGARSSSVVGRPGRRDRDMADHHRFMRDLLWLAAQRTALSADGLNVFHVHDQNRFSRSALGARPCQDLSWS